MYFGHIGPYMDVMANLLRQQQPATGVMDWVRQRDEARAARSAAGPGRNDPCPCGSGRKFKRCCGNVVTAGKAT